VVGTAVLERIKQSLQYVVDIATPSIGRMNLNVDGERACKRLNFHRTEQCADVAAKFAATFADQRPSPHPPPVMNDTGRVGHLNKQHRSAFPRRSNVRHGVVPRGFRSVIGR